MINYKQNGFDTETVHGYARIVATSNKYWKVNSFEDIIKPMILEASNHGTAYFCWNINYDMRAILKYLPKEVLQQLASDENKAEYQDYEIFFIEGKLCTITYTGFTKNKSISFYDMAQYYNYLSLDDAAEKYLNKNKIDNPVTKNIKKHQNDWEGQTIEKYYEDNYHEIGKYCQQDAFLTAQLASIMAKKVREVFGISLRRWTSKASIAEKLSYKKGHYPINFGEGSKHYNYAQLSFRGGMFDCYQRGRFLNGVTEIDISSAYPAVQSKQPHWGNGKFHDITNESEIKDTDYYGWFLTIFDCPYIPYDSQQMEMWEEYHNGKIVDIYSPNRKKVYYPTGLRQQVLTLHEIRFLKKYGYEYEIDDGYVWRQEKDEFKSPFDWMNKVYDKKAEYKKSCGKESIEYSLVKIELNGNYGKTVQTVGAHVMQDFRYGSYITAETRVKLISFILDHKLEDKVILIATDGIYLDGIHKFNDLGSGIGSWDCDYYDSGIFLGNGIYQTYGKKSKLKLRGYGSGSYNWKNYGKIEFDLLSSLQKHRTETVYLPRHKAMHKPKPNSFKMCLKLLDKSEEDINVFEYRDKAISSFTDRTKHWPGINTFNDLLTGTHRGIRYTIDEIEEKSEMCDRLRDTMFEKQRVSITK